MPHCPCTNFITKIVFVQRWAYTWFSRRGLSDSLTNILSIRREKKIHHFFLTLLLRYFDFHLILWIYVTWGGGVKSSLTTTPHMLNQCTPLSVRSFVAAQYNCTAAGTRSWPFSCVLPLHLPWSCWYVCSALHPRFWKKQGIESCSWSKVFWIIKFLRVHWLEGTFLIFCVIVNWIRIRFL